jgi:hypothetical protein
MQRKSAVWVVPLVLVSIAVGYAAGKIRSAQEAKESVFAALVTLGKGEKMSDKELWTAVAQMRDASDFLWDKVAAQPDDLMEHDLAVLCANEALQVSLALGMVGNTDLYKNAVKAGGDDAPNTEKLAESMGAVTGFLLATTDPQLWEQKMGKHGEGKAD